MELDLVIRGGTVVDGSGQPGQRADVGVSGDRISAVGDLSAATAAQTLDATGLVVTPGFIDIHTHSEFSLLLDPRGESKVRQGVTTEVVSNCSYAPYPMRPQDIAEAKAQRIMHGAELLDWDWNDLEGYRRRYNSQGAAINVAPLAGHAAIRVIAMGYDKRAPTPDELATMQRLLAETMEQGAFGFSAGLTLAPSGYADTDELVALCEVAARYGGYYAAHMRVYAGQQLRARHETLEIGRRAGIPVQMSHNNVMFRPFWHLVPEILELLEQESAAGVDVSLRCLPIPRGNVAHGSTHARLVAGRRRRGPAGPPTGPGIAPADLRRDGTWLGRPRSALGLGIHPPDGCGFARPQALGRPHGRSGRGGTRC